MTSGSLIKASAFLKTGLYDEAMFIDYVDFDFCLRLWQQGYKLIRSCRSGLLHHLGSLEAYSFLGFPITITSHNAVRRYYIMRNRVIMYRRYAVAFPFWVIKDFLWLCLDLTKIIVFEHDKSAKLRHAFKGLRHGLAGITGPLPVNDI
jgi:rhamnosyltransferase